MDSNLLLFIFLTFNGNKDLQNPLMDFVSSLDIKAGDTEEKIRTLRKIMTCLPEKYLGLINRSILYTEEIVRIYELGNSFKDNSYDYVTTSNKVRDNREKISKVLQSLQNESPDIYDDKLGVFMDLLMNMDNYRKMFDLFVSIAKYPDNIKDPPDSTKGPSSLINPIPSFMEDER